MKLIVNKNTYQSFDAFFNEVKQNMNLIEGVSIEVIETKDGIPIVITPYLSNATNTQVIIALQNTNLKDIKDYEVLTLEAALSNLKDITKKIVINFIPIPTTPYAQNIELINEINQNQVNNLYKILNMYPTLNFYVSSISHNIIYHMKRNLIKYKIGVILTQFETNYIDVDFYIFSPEMLSFPILKQQLSFNKEIMISTRGNEDMMTIYNFFHKFPEKESEVLINSVSFITSYPIILYQLLN